MRTATDEDDPASPSRTTLVPRCRPPISIVPKPGSPDDGAWVPDDEPPVERCGEPPGEPGSDERSTGASARAIQSRTAVEGTKPSRPDSSSNKPVDALRRPTRRPPSVATAASTASAASSMEPRSPSGRTSRNMKSSASTSLAVNWTTPPPCPPGPTIDPPPPPPPPSALFVLDSSSTSSPASALKWCTAKASRSWSSRRSRSTCAAPLLADLALLAGEPCGLETPRGGDG